MTPDVFATTKHFNYFGYVPPLDLTKGGRYTHVTTDYCEADDNFYDIVCDDNMNFYFVQAFPDGVVIEL